ncbi:hypothetical protein ACIQZN_26600 [Streptomyces sp. NPDC097595]|uniref:hypothetical protein n=1 Tax=Streptomyces sp. NPDC097595 TaxID=3366090 RepID=UPI00382112DC
MDTAARPAQVRGLEQLRDDDVELHFLPRYSPELLPGKLVNADLKHSLPDSTGPVHRAGPGACRWRTACSWSPRTGART